VKHILCILLPFLNILFLTLLHSPHLRTKYDIESYHPSPLTFSFQTNHSFMPLPGGGPDVPYHFIVRRLSRKTNSLEAPTGFCFFARWNMLTFCSRPPKVAPYWPFLDVDQTVDFPFTLLCFPSYVMTLFRIEAVFPPHKPRPLALFSFISPFHLVNFSGQFLILLPNLYSPHPHNQLHLSLCGVIPCFPLSDPCPFLS